MPSHFSLVLSILLQLKTSSKRPEGKYGCILRIVTYDEMSALGVSTDTAPVTFSCTYRKTK